MSFARSKHSSLLRLLAASPAIFAMFSAYAAEEQAAPVQQQEAKPAPRPSTPPARPAAAPEQKMQQVEIKGTVQAYDDRRNDTATKIVVTQEEIIKNGDTNISEVLKRLPGITLGGVQGRGGAIRMRGMGNGYTSIMLNGEPAPPGFSLDSISPDMIERIEIMRAATAEYSTQAVAGAINVILRKAVQTGQREVKFGFQEDNGKLGANGNLQIADRKGPISYAINGGFGRGQFDRLPTQVTETNVDPQGRQTGLRESVNTSRGTFEGFGFSPRLNWTVAPGETLTSQSFINVNNFSGVNGERTVTRLGPAPLYASNDYDIESKFAMARSDLSWSKRLAAGAKAEAKFGVNWNRRENNVALRLADVNGQRLMNRIVDSSASDKGATANGKYSTPFAQDHAVSIGWDGGISDRSEDRFQRDKSPVGLKEINSDEVFSASVKRLAVFGQDEWNVTPRWSVYLGLRWEGLDTTSEGNTYAAVKNRSSVWSPIMQTLWKIPDTKNDQMRFAVTRTYKAPATNLLIPRRFTATNNSVTTPDTQGNPNLRPELAWGLDLSYEHFLPDGGLLSASTFVRRIEDITRRELVLIDGLWVSRPVNDGVATTRGIELEAKVPLRAYYKSAPALEFRMNLARNWSTISTVPGPNNRIDQQTPFSGNFGIDWKLDALPLTVGGNYNFQAGGPVRISEKQSVYTVPKRTIDMFGVWKFNPKNQLRVALSNVLHQDNITQNTYVDTFGTAQSVTLVPTSLVVRANLEIKF